MSNYFTFESNDSKDIEIANLSSKLGYQTNDNHRYYITKNNKQVSNFFINEGTDNVSFTNHSQNIKNESISKDTFIQELKRV